MTNQFFLRCSSLPPSPLPQATATKNSTSPGDNFDPGTHMGNGGKGEVFIPLKRDQKSIHVLLISNTFLCLHTGYCIKGQNM